MKKILCLLLIGFVTGSQTIDGDGLDLLGDNENVNNVNIQYVDSDEDVAPDSDDESGGVWLPLDNDDYRKELERKLMKNFQGCTIS